MKELTFQKRFEQFMWTAFTIICIVSAITGCSSADAKNEPKPDIVAGQVISDIGKPIEVDRISLENGRREWANSLYKEYSDDIVRGRDDGEAIIILIEDETTYTWGRNDDLQSVLTPYASLMRKITSELDEGAVPYTVTRLDLPKSKTLECWQINWSQVRFVPLLHEQGR
jgi:hypothetical protein